MTIMQNRHRSWSGPRCGSDRPARGSALSAQAQCAMYEFAEIGVNQRLGYVSPADVAEQYPTFFWSKVEPYIGEAISHLELTMEGRQWIAQLYSNVFALEHHRQHMGPQVGASTSCSCGPRSPSRQGRGQTEAPANPCSPDKNLADVLRSALLWLEQATPCVNRQRRNLIMRHNRLRALLTADEPSSARTCCRAGRHWWSSSATPATMTMLNSRPSMPHSHMHDLDNLGRALELKNIGGMIKIEQT